MSPAELARLLNDRARTVALLRARDRDLHSRCAAAETELAGLQRETAGLVQRGAVGFAWGDFFDRVPSASGRLLAQAERVRRELARHAADFDPPLLEVLPDANTASLAPDPAAATVIAGTALAEQLRALPAAGFATILLPWILHRVPAPRPVLFECRRRLKPGGRLFTTVPGPAAPRAAGDPDRDYHRFTLGSARRLFRDYFPARGVMIEPVGTLAEAIAAWYGLEPLEADAARPGDINPAFPLLLAIRAEKPQ